MEFTIENGKNICAIGTNGGCSYIRFDYPLTVVWYDRRGSISKYFCSLPYNENYRKVVRNKILDNLNIDFTDCIEDLYDILQPLFPIFKNGKYSLNFYSEKEKEFFQYRTSFDGGKELHYYGLDVLFSSAIDSKEANNVIIKHQNFLNENEISKKYYPVKLIDYTTSSFYDSESSLYATQPFESIDQNRVAYYEELIKKGEKPFAIIFNTTYSFNFILDGHHKLLAYKNLKLYPPIAVITYLPQNTDEVEYDTEKFSKLLYPWQIDHILKKGNNY